MKKKLDIERFWKKIRNHASVAGQKLIYSVLLMFYAFRRNQTPAWAKSIILGSLAYFVAPFDSVPDLTPVLGYTDDLGVLSFGLVTVASYIDGDVREKARNQMNRLFGQLKPETLREVDDQL